MANKYLDLTGLQNLVSKIKSAFVSKTGDTMTGKLTLKGGQYSDEYNAGSLNLNNSNIDNVNSIYTADLADNSKEGIHFYRTATTVDTLRATNGKLFFTPNRTLGTEGTSYEVMHDGKTLSAGNLSSGYVNIHPENNPVLIPFMHNDIAHLLKRGGSAKLYHDGVEVTNKDMTPIFDGSGSYFSYAATTLADITEIVIEITCHQTFTYNNWIYIDFGNVGWRAKNVKIEVMNGTSTYPNDVWTQKYSTTSNASGHIAFNMQHVPVGASNAGGGFNKLRFTLSDWNSTQFRISQIGIYNYGSLGLRQPFMSRGNDDPIFRNITPNTTNTYSLGTSTRYWNLLYVNKINANSIATGGIESTGRILTSFKQSVAIGSYAPSASTIPDIIDDLRYSSGAMGSFNLSTEFTLNSVTVSTGWYTYIYVPHRTGGVNGEASGDNTHYGTLYLTRMNTDAAYPIKMYAIRYSGQQIKRLVELTDPLTVNNHTVNSDVPANAEFTDTVTTAATTGTGNAVTAITALNGALTVTKGATFLTEHQDISGKLDKPSGGTVGQVLAKTETGCEWRDDVTLTASVVGEVLTLSNGYTATYPNADEVSY